MSNTTYGPMSLNDAMRAYGAFLFGTPTGLCLVAIATVMLIVTLMSQRIKWVWLSLFLYATTLQFSEMDQEHGHLLFPFNILRSFGRPLTMALLVLLLVPTFQASVGTRRKLFSAPATAFFSYEFLFSALLVLGGASILRGVFGGLTFVAIFAVLGLGLPRWIQTPDDIRSALRSVMVAVAIVYFGTVVNLLFRHSQVMEAGRLTGTTANPQFLGAFVAFTLPINYGLLLYKGQTRPWRFFLLATFCLSIVFLIWTGSRAGALVALCGLIAFFRARLGQLSIVGICMAIVVILGLELVGPDLAGAGSHLLATNDSRSSVWGYLIGLFLAHPIYGTLSESYAESTYLSTAAAFGLVGLASLSILVALAGREMTRLMRRRRELGRHRVLADICIAVIAGILVGSAFDNHMMGTLALPVLLLYVAFAVSSAVLDPAVATVEQSSAGSAGSAGADEAPAPLLVEYPDPLDPSRPAFVPYDPMPELARPGA